MANTGLRPDEATRLEYRDVTVVKDDDTKETILEMRSGPANAARVGARARRRQCFRSSAW
jgi:hypothetical protein